MQFVWFSLAQSVRFRTLNHFNKAVLIVGVRVQPGAECAKIAYSMRVRIAPARVVPNEGCSKPFVQLLFFVIFWQVVMIGVPA